MTEISEVALLTGDVERLQTFYGDLLGAPGRLVELAQLERC